LTRVAATRRMATADRRRIINASTDAFPRALLVRAPTLDLSQLAGAAHASIDAAGV